MCGSSCADREPQVCVIVINWNGKENLKLCLRSVLKQDYSARSVWVLDNASTDGSAEMVREEFQNVKVIRCGRNLGYTGAANIGISCAREQNYEYVLILANDIVLDPRCISMALAAAQTHPGAGMIGFRMIGATSYVPFKGFEKESCEWVSLEIHETGSVEGAAFLASPAVIERLGGYDETLFMYGDENDLEARLVGAGYSLLNTNVPVWHNCGRNVMGERKLCAAFYTHRNTLILRIKHESLRSFLRQALSLIRLACDPFLNVPSDDVVTNRYRPSNVLVNGLVVLAALFSIGWKLARVLRTRNDHRKLIERERQLLRATR